jgi:RNA polymerase sigma factor (sigma-70 family)
VPRTATTGAAAVFARLDCGTPRALRTRSPHSPIYGLRRRTIRAWTIPCSNNRCAATVCQKRIIRSEELYGSRVNNTAFPTLKIAVQAPILKAITAITAREKPRLFWISRSACSERTFLFRIAHNRAIAHLSRSRSQPVTGEDVEVHDPAPDPEAGLAQEQQVERLRRAIHQLPVVYRQVTILSLEGLGYGEIAEVLGISESNLGTRLTRQSVQVFG